MKSTLLTSFKTLVKKKGINLIAKRTLIVEVTFQAIIKETLDTSFVSNIEEIVIIACLTFGY